MGEQRVPDIQDQQAAPLVFAELRDVQLTDREVVAIAGVTSNAAAVWREGTAPVPSERRVLLTLVLTHLAEELLASGGKWAVARFPWHARFREQLESTRCHLAALDAASGGISEHTVGQGQAMSRPWWNAERYEVRPAREGVATTPMERRILEAG